MFVAPAGTPVLPLLSFSFRRTFGAAASLEGAYYVKYKKLISLSEQNILDCSFNNGDMACDGGTAYNAYAWLMSTGGLESEEEYPYRMQSDYCRLDASGVKITGYVNVTMGDEQALKSAVAKMPVTVAINTGACVCVVS